MITVRLKGGLGNQLFQYATSYALAKRTNSEMKMDVRFFGDKLDRAYRLDNLKVQNSSIVNERLSLLTDLLSNKYLNKCVRKLHVQKLEFFGTRYIFDSSFHCLNPEIFKFFEGNTYIEGYYQSEEYFKEYRKDLLAQFVPSYKLENEYLDVLTDIQSTDSCAVHVRRGDFLNYQKRKNSRSVFYILEFDYYKKALEYMSKYMNNPVFYWFSDDIDWVKQNVGKGTNMQFISLHTKNPDIDELMLMKHCNNIITANSSFSWWAAWLNNGCNAIKIVPKRAFGNPYMIPESWIKL